MVLVVLRKAAGSVEFSVLPPFTSVGVYVLSNTSLVAVGFVRSKLSRLARKSNFLGPLGLPRSVSRMEGILSRKPGLGESENSKYCGDVGS